jgi:diguanylate cyclase (GGDEF)-like protein
VTDALTGLWNRRKFFEETQRLLGVLQETGGPCSLLILDLDDFKGLNDTFGHPAGDDVLKQVAQLLGETRQSADIVARLGGEEFIVVMPGAEAVGAVRVAERLRASIEEHPWQLRPLTASVGIATLRDPGKRGTSTSALVSGLLRAADLALYASKKGGRNRVTHADSLADAEAEE